MINAAGGTALILTGPGCYSLDRLFKIKIPWWVTALVSLGAGVALVTGLLMEPEDAEEPAATGRAA